MEKLVEFVEKIKRRWSPAAYDTRVHPAEAYYGSIYMRYLSPYLEDLNTGSGLDILDAGCGTGRFSIPLAEMGNRIRAVDFHKGSIQVANENAARSGLDIDFIEDDITHAVAAFRDSEFDISMSIEALLICKDYSEIISHLHRITRTGGLLFITHRTPFYYIMQALSEGNYDDAILVQNNTEGRLKKGHHRIYYNWQTNAQIDSIYSSNGSTILGKYSIGPYSGFNPDAMKNICDSELITDEQRNKLFELESNQESAEETLMASRYVLVVAQVN